MNTFVTTENAQSLEQDNVHDLNLSNIKLYIAWFSISIFFFYQYILRVLPGIMIHDIRSEFGLMAEQFSTLGSLYLFAYAIIQIPNGIIIDKIGVKRLALFNVGVCIASGILFSYANSYLTLQITRFFLGLSSGCGLMCSLKFAFDHFPKGKKGFLMGATLSLGTLGPIFASVFLIDVMQKLGWRTASLYASLLGFIILAGIIIFVPNPKNSLKFKELFQSNNKKDDGTIYENLLSVLKNKNILKYGCLAAALFTPLSVLADLWGTSFLIQKFSLELKDAAVITMMMYLGLAFGSLIIPYFAEKKHIMTEAIQICVVIVSFILLFIIFGPYVNKWALLSTIIILGIFCGAEMMCFTGATSYSGRGKSGTTIGIVNTINMMGGAIAQQTIGFSLDFQWSGLVNESGLRIYNHINYENALGSLVIIMIFSSIVSYNLKAIKK